MSFVGLAAVERNSKHQPFEDLAAIFGLSAVGLTIAFVSLSRERKMAKDYAYQLERKQYEAETSETRLRLTASSMGIGVWSYDFHAKKLEWDKRMFDLYERDRSLEPFTTQEWLDAMHPDDRGGVAKNIVDAKQSGTFSMRFRVLREGEIRHFRTLARVSYDEFGGALEMTGITWDITGDVRSHETIEEQRAKLASAARLASLGEMASGVAHEINNPLQIILGQASMLRSRMLRETVALEEILKTLEKIEGTADRIGTIVRGLRTVARDGDQDPFIDTSLQSVVSDALALCSERIRGKDIRLETDLDAIESISIPCRSVQISQVFLNLLTNAYHAVENQSERWLRIESVRKNDFIEFAVVDSGPGIRPEHRAKIFQPFFTTKDVGKGTGLGLSISLSIARDHGGELTLDPESERTRFVLRLPINGPDKITLSS